jgi:hypothetical protein
VDSFVERIDTWLLALIFASAMFASWALGWRRGRSQGPPSGEDPELKFIDASVAVLALLLAFTFAMALGRHDQRRLAVVAESNAIGDFYTCASLLREPYRAKLENAIRDYGKFQLDTSSGRLTEASEKLASDRCLEMQGHMTAIVAEAISADPSLTLALANTLNNVTSTNASRLAMYQEKLPWSIILVLLLSAIIPAFLIGEKQGLSHKVHFSGPSAFVMLVTLVILVTLDLNEPRHGLIRVSQGSLERVIQSMGK